MLSLPKSGSSTWLGWLVREYKAAQPSSWTHSEAKIEPQSSLQGQSEARTVPQTAFLLHFFLVSVTCNPQPPHPSLVSLKDPNDCLGACFGGN